MIPQEWRSRFIEENLYRNGAMIERARREGRSLREEERSLIMGARNVAKDLGVSRVFMNSMEMQGAEDKKLVFSPLKVDIRFAFYHEPFEDIPATASYYVVESNYAPLPKGSNVGEDQLKKFGFKIPKTPSYDEWVKAGRVCYRGRKKGKWGLLK